MSVEKALSFWRAPPCPEGLRDRPPEEGAPYILHAPRADCRATEAENESFLEPGGTRIGDRSLAGHGSLREPRRGRRGRVGTGGWDGRGSARGRASAFHPRGVVQSLAAARSE